MAIYNFADVKAGSAKPVPGDIVVSSDGYPYKYAGGGPVSAQTMVPLQGKEYLQALPQSRRNLVQALLTGNMEFPSANTRTMKGGPTFGTQLLTDAANVDPTFNQATYKARVAALKDFTSGYDSKTIASLNQAPLHALELARAMQGLGNQNDGALGDNWLARNVAYPALNLAGTTWQQPGPTNERRIANAVASGDTGMQAAEGSYKAAHGAVGDELASVYTGKAGTVPGIEEQMNVFPEGAPPSQSNAAFSTVSKLLRDRQATLVAKWRKAMGPIADLFPVVDPRSSQALDTLDAMTRGGKLAAGATTPAPATRAASAAPPAGVDPVLWSHMTPQEKALWH
ncbi:MAG TPA: hypothetical protein VMT89_01905 [Candidatus Acidoferrales bacterium]|nr:hypothetical protein [Candidatus Acidoferrales bacterium]